METFITSTVFNPNLRGKAVHIKGYDIEGEWYDRVFLVKDVSGEQITLVNSNGEFIEDIYLENFTYEDDALKITVLEELANE
ncbi:hypothetical protein F3157_07980 [Virgibacillus dakarensis]|nr:hypothetical protein [Virgibacillus dakarensis]